MLPQKQGIIINTSFDSQGHYLGNVFYDLAKASINRFAFGLSHDLRPHNIAAIALSPGWMRTERVVAGYQGKEHELEGATESVEYIGRAVACLAADATTPTTSSSSSTQQCETGGDEGVMGMSGKTIIVADLAKKYEFTDIDGRVVPAFNI